MAKNTDEELKILAKEVYENERRYHGTDKTSATRIRANGFRMADKTAFTEASREPHHYITGNKNVASDFARLGGQQAGLVRTLGAHTNKHTSFERDPCMNDPSALRTKNDIAPKYVLGSKKSRPGKDAEVFQRRLRIEGAKVNLATAGRLLRDVQSDSEDYFT